MKLVGIFITVFVNLRAVSGQSASTCFVGDIRLGQNLGSNTYIRATASNATYTITSFTASSCSIISWSFNITQPPTVVAQYNFGSNLPVYAGGYENGELTVSVTTVVAGQSNVTLQINNVSASQTGISVSASNSATFSSSTLPLNVKNCEILSTGSGVIVAPTSPLPCGFGCTVQYSCASGYTGNDVTATCQEDATFDASPICINPSLTTGEIVAIVIGCIIAVAIIIFFLIPICCAEICCCAFTILCLSWGKKKYTAGRS
uniref:VCRL1 variant E n=1 Tax=Ciona intestinalis TaxID=7719 RepID=I3NN92_CIOIN|nr:vCRL1 variant E [Ciona intestinalis]